MSNTSKDIKILKLEISTIFHEWNFQPFTSHDTDSEIESLSKTILANLHKHINQKDFIELIKDFSLAEYGYVPNNTNKVAESIYKRWTLRLSK